MIGKMITYCLKSEFNLIKIYILQSSINEPRL